MEESVAKLFGDHILDEAARRYRISTGTYKKLGDFENYVYEVDLNGEPRILRLTHSSHRSEDEVAAELDWISHLVSEGLDIPACYTSVNGKLTEVIEAGDSYFTACLFGKANGHLPDYRNDAEWNADLFRRWGELTGRMHAATVGYKTTPGARIRHSWEDDEILQNAKSYVRPGDEFVLQRLDEVFSRLRSLPREADVFGLIHTDIHPRNFFVDNGRLNVFDFDDCAYNWFVHDIAIPLYYTLTWMPEESMTGGKQAFAARFVRAFWDGYRSAYSLPTAWLQEIPYFLKLRDITLYLVIHKKVDPRHWEPRLQRMMEGISDRLRRNAAIVELDYGQF